MLGVVKGFNLHQLRKQASEYLNFSIWHVDELLEFSEYFSSS